MNMKSCSMCKRALGIAEFGRDATRKDGLDCICLDCRKNYRLNNKAKENERRKKWYHEHGKIERTRNRTRYIYKEAQKCAVTTCEDLGQRHHINYSDPEAIIWLCQKHHSAIHVFSGVGNELRPVPTLI